MSTFLLLYALCGLLFVTAEHRLLNEDVDYEPSTKLKLLGALQLIVQYTRLLLMWPLYLLEDGIIWLSYDDTEGEEDE